MLRSKNICRDLPAAHLVPAVPDDAGRHRAARGQLHEALRWSVIVRVKCMWNAVLSPFEVCLRNFECSPRSISISCIFFPIWKQISRSTSRADLGSKTQGSLGRCTGVCSILCGSAGDTKTSAVLFGRFSLHIAAESFRGLDTELSHTF